MLEHRFNSDTGASTNGTSFWGGAGTSEVNLSSDAMGMVRLGHFTSEAYFATSDVTDLLNHGTGTSSDAFYKYLGNDSNKVSYRTPSFAGATVELGTSLGEGVTANRVMDLAVNYGAGPLGLGFGYEKVKNGDSQYAIRANFETGPFLVTGYVQRYKNEALSENQTIYRISGMYTMGASEFHLAFGKQGDLGPVDVSAKQYTIGYNYNLSKRTKVYTYYNKISVDAAGSPDPKTIAVGIRHNF